MSKKQIKELVIQTSSKGTKEVLNEVTSLNEALKGAVTTSDALTSSLKGGAKYIGQIATAYANVTKSINGSVDSVRKLNTALNGDTKKATQSISAYLDNLQILNLELNSTSISANKAANALGRMASVSQLETLINNIEDMAHELEMLRTTSEKSLEVLKKGFYDLGQSIERTEDVAIDTTQAINKLGTQVGNAGEKTDKAKKQTDLFNNSLRRLSSTGSSSARAFSSLAFGMNPLVAAYAAIAVNIYAVTEAFRVLKDASSLQRLEEQTAGFASAMSGLNVKDIAKDIQDASAGALAFSEALKTAVRGVSFDFTRDQLIELTDGARKASIALGIDFTDAMDRVIRGISKQEVELLDELGVVTRLETAFANYVAKAGIAGLTVNKLTDAQRKLALTQEVNYQLQLRYGESIEKVTTGWERLGVVTTDLSNTILKGLASSLEGSANGLSDLFERLTPVSSSAMAAAESQKTFNKALEDNKTSQATAALGEYYKSLLELDSTTKQTVESLGQQAEAIDKVSTVLAGIVAIFVGAKLVSLILGGVAAFSRLAIAVGGAAKALVMLRGAITLLSGPIGVIIGALTAIAGTATYLTFDAASESLNEFGKEMTGFNEVGNATAKTMREQAENAAYYRTKLLEAVAAAKKIKDTGVDLKLPEFNFSTLTEQSAKSALEALSTYLAKSGADMNAFEKGIADSSNRIGKNFSDLGRVSTSIDTIVDSFDALYLGADKFYTNNVKLQQMFSATWENLKVSGFISKDLELTEENFKKVRDRLLQLQQTEISIEKDRSRALLPVQMQGKDDAGLAIARNELELLQRQYEARKAIGGVIGENYRFETGTQILVTKEKIKQLEIDKRLEAASRERTILSEQLMANAEVYGTAQSNILMQKRSILQAEIAQLEAEGRGTEEASARLRLLDVEIAKQKQLEAIEMRKAGLDIALQNQQAVTAKAGTEQARVASLEKELTLKRAQIEANTTLEASEKARQLNSLSLEQASVAGMKDGAAFKDASNVLGNIVGLEGLSDLQSTFAGTMSSLSGTYSQFLTDMEGQSGSFMDYLSNNTDALANVLSSSLSLAQAAFAEISKGKIESIDAEIEAEKRRDGKSEESMAKIKKLQAQKIKEEAKAKKASVAMSTATGIMNIWAGPMGAFPPAAAAMSAALAGLGMLQLANIDKAASGQLAALSGGSGNLSISGGNRSNEIDVSRRANAGELAYLQGASGTGTAGNFTPGKAIGGYSSAGTSIVVGESGPEVITPAVPVNVTPAGQAGSSVQITLSPVFNTSTIDSSGFEQLTQRFSRELYDGLERELRARNRTLDNL